MPGAGARRGAALAALAAAAAVACGSDDERRAEPAAQAPPATTAPATTATTADAQPPRLAQAAGLAAALRRGGHVLVFRHAATDRSQADAQRFAYSQCARQRNLDATGRAQARAIGRAIRSMRVPIGRVLASPYCRTSDTAQLAFGRVERSEVLLPVPSGADGEERGEARLRELLSDEPDEGNTVLVGHVTNLRLAVDATPEEGGAVVLRPDGDGRFLLVAEIAPGAWARLAAR
jgi:phosphohistidine phosphatase SixA